MNWARRNVASKRIVMAALCFMEGGKKECLYYFWRGIFLKYRQSYNQMEIPIIKLELYRQNPGQFTQELDRARQTEKVAQISGLEQQLVDDLYGYMQQHAQEIHMPDENSLGKNFYLQIFAFFPADDQEAYLLRSRPQLNQLVEGINKNLAEIADAVANACVSLYGSFKRPR